MLLDVDQRSEVKLWQIPLVFFDLVPNFAKYLRLFPTVWQTDFGRDYA